MTNPIKSFGQVSWPINLHAKALDKVATVVNDALADGSDEPFIPGAVVPEDFYVVWFAKTLQNWKALVSTDLVAGHYFEVTYNGDRLETYVDWYVRQSNTALPDVAPDPKPHTEIQGD